MRIYEESGHEGTDGATDREERWVVGEWDHSFEEVVCDGMYSRGGGPRMYMGGGEPVKERS